MIDFTSTDLISCKRLDVAIRICNRMRPSRIKNQFSLVFSKFSICENFENTSEN